MLNKGRWSSRLLQRQLRRHVAPLSIDFETLEPFVQAIDDAYEQHEQDRQMLERSLELVSEELLEKNRQLADELSATLEARQELGSVLNAFPDGVFIVDRQGLARSIPGVEPDERLAPFLQPEGELETQFLATLKEANRGERRQFEYAIGKPPDSEHFEVRFQELSEDEYLVVVRDVTKLRDLQRQLALSDRMASVGTLAAGVAHEINNPLTYVSGNLELLAMEIEREGFDRREMRELIADAASGADRVRDIVTSLSAFSRHHKDDLEVMALGPVVENALKLMSLQLDQQVQCTADLAEVRAKVNGSKLQQVLINLLKNAIQAFDGGDPSTNQVHVRLFVDDGGHPRIEVTDNGVGMNERDQAAAFDPFFTSKPVGEGTGLGLSLCHELMEEMGGAIELNSVEGEGTTVLLSLEPAA